MSAQAKIHPATPSPAYEADGYGWAMAQAALLKQRKFDAVDWDNVIEEIESVGASEYRVVESALRLVLLHHLKWEKQAHKRSRSWQVSIKTHLRCFDRELGRNPGLRASLPQIMVDAYADARDDAAVETGIDIDTFPVDPPSWDEIRATREL